MRFLENDKKDKVLATDIIKVNDHFILNDVALVNKLRYNQLSISQLVDADLSVFFHKSDSRVLDSSSGLVCADFSIAQPSLRCLLSLSSSEL
jgi:hypothetical protein